MTPGKQDRDKPARDKIVRNRFLADYSLLELAYWRSLKPAQRRAIVAAQEDAADETDDIPMRFKVLQAGFKPHQTRRLLQFMDTCCGEDAQIKRREYLEFVCRIPTRCSLVSPEGGVSERLAQVSKRLDTAIFGQEKTKRALLRVVAQWLMNPGSKGMSIGLHGSYGVGKTKISLAVSQALDMPFSLIALGGMTDSSGLVGHDFTYLAAQPGSIARAFVRGGDTQQVFMFDELDKISNTAKGDEIANVLVHLTDETQNERFHDKYVGDIDLDMSKCLMVFTFNEESNIPPVLLDRMTVIDVEGYSIKSKMQIASKHLVPDALKAFALTGSTFADTISSEAFLRQAILDTSEEKGVRNLRRAIRAVCAEVNLRKAEDGESDLTDKDLMSILKSEAASTRLNTSTHLSMYS